MSETLKTEVWREGDLNPRDPSGFWGFLVATSATAKAVAIEIATVYIYLGNLR
jgi:hypothetical protein